MPTVEVLCQKILANPTARKKLLIGSLLSFIPLVNVFALGYCLRYFRSLVHDRQIDLPEWSEWEALLTDGLKALCIIILFALVPLSFAFILSSFINLLSFGFLSWLGSLLILAVSFLVPPLCFCTLVCFLRSGDNWRSLLAVGPIAEDVRHLAGQLWFPTLALWGFWLLTWPIYGFGFFIGMLVYGAYVSIVASLEK